MRRTSIAYVLLIHMRTASSLLRVHTCRKLLRPETFQPICQRRLFISSDAQRPSEKEDDVLEYQVQLNIPGVEDMEDVGATLATTWLDVSGAQPTCLFLQGDLGAGKTAFARGFVQGALGDDTVRVTSPTYLLSNTYPILDPAIDIHHMDLYRLSGSKEDFVALNLPHVFSSCISLIEWPSRLLHSEYLSALNLPKNRVTVDIRLPSFRGNDVAQEEVSSGRRVMMSTRGTEWYQCFRQIIEEERLMDDLLL